MKSLAALSTLLGAAVAAVAPTAVSYDGYKVFRVPVGAREHRVNAVVADLGLGVWQPASRKGAFADVAVPPDAVDAFRRKMGGLDVVTMHEDLGRSIAEEAAFAVYAEGSANSTWFNSYHPYRDHLRWLADLAAQFSGKAEVVTSGKSLHGNAITGIHIFGSGGKGVRPAVVFHGTVHAREWISTMVVEYLAYALLSGYQDDAETRGFVDKYDFYLFPIVNPDGFQYSQTRDRLWRKNRQSSGDSSCVGHDINRNWPFQWGPGASSNPCSESYRGESEGDAPETQSLARFLKGVKDSQGLKLYIDYHSYSQLFMTPYGWTCDSVPANNDELQALARGAAEAIRSVHGIEFEHGPICSTIYQASGSSVDYVNDVVQADYSFTTELRDQGRYGFVLPPDQIVPSGEEAFAGVKYLLQNMK